MQRILFTLTAISCLLATGPAWAGGESIKFMLNGKQVVSAPVDQWGNMQVVVSSGSSTFRQIFSKGWGDMNHSLRLGLAHFNKGMNPDLRKLSYSTTYISD